MLHVQNYKFESGVTEHFRKLLARNLKNRADILLAGLLKEPFKAVNGYVELDDTKYGLGIELDESVIEKYRVEL